MRRKEEAAKETAAAPVKAAEKRKTTRRKRAGAGDTLFYEILGVVLLCVGIFVCAGLLGAATGPFGESVADLFHLLFGVTAIVPAAAIALFGARYLYTGRGFSLTWRWVLIGFLYVLALGWLHYFVMPAGRIVFLPDWAGLLGAAVATGLAALLGHFGTMLALLALTVCDILFLTRWHISGGVQKLGEKTETGVKKASQALEKRRAERKERTETKIETEAASETEMMPIRSDVGLPEDFLYQKEEPQETAVDTAESEKTSMMPEPEESSSENVFPAETKEAEASEENEPEEKTPEANEPDVEMRPEETEEKQSEKDGPTYRFPPLTLLHRGESVASGRADTEKNATLLESTFKSFGVDVRVTNVTMGPTVTQYEVEPAMGVKVSRILSLQNDIAMALAATHIRIEAPIPGKSAVGIEVPNAKATEVPLGDVLDSEDFKKARRGVPVALGKDITGRTVVADLTKMPHLLIAGSTGSGKSVCINTIITSILYRCDPDAVKLILVDPKVVELSVYNGIPHLRIPVVTDPKRAAGALHWAVQEMEDRYRRFSLDHVRDIKGYNEANPETRLPYIVIIIDELADLMMVAKEGVETAICRLAQKARAAGIHMVLATQRPSTNVITGTIKANIPSRISFAVSSQIDSRVILDTAGAEKLVGKGDMLFHPIGAPHPVRVQGAFISDEEVAAVTDFIKQDTAEIVEYEAINLSLPAEEPASEEGSLFEEDELLWDAAEWILDTKKASVSMLQRRFRIGYTRAGRLMDTLERMGIVGPADGARPREILMTKEEVQEHFHGD